MLTARKKKNIMADFQDHPTDTGSAAVQIALVTRQIEELTKHLKKNPKDHSSRRGLLKMVGKRRRLMRYLFENDEKTYNTISKKVGVAL